MSNEEEGATRSKEPRGVRSHAEEGATRRKEPRGERSHEENKYIHVQMYNDKAWSMEHEGA